MTADLETLELDNVKLAGAVAELKAASEMMSDPAWSPSPETLERIIALAEEAHAHAHAIRIDALTPGGQSSSSRSALPRLPSRHSEWDRLMWCRYWYISARCRASVSAWKEFRK